MNRFRKYFMTASPARALMEALLVSSLLFFGIVPVMDHVEPFVVYESLAFIAMVAALVNGLRARPLEGTRWHILWLEAARGSLLAGGMVTAAFIILQAFPGASRLPGQLFNLAILLLALPGYLGVRALVWLWVFWDNLRRKHFMWALTNAHLTVVVLIALLLLMAGIASNGGVFGRSPALDIPVHILPAFLTRLVIQVFPWLLITGFVAFVGLALVLPPSAIFSVLVSRRLTRRLDDLVSATRQLRAGDMGARVPVEGEDEVAQLQSDFNAMAADLQASALALQQERDKVAGLLAAQRQLTASVSHELRTPVATVRGYIESLLDRVGAASDQQPENLRADLDVISHEIDRLQRLIDDLFTLSRAEVNQLGLTLQPVALDELVTLVSGTVAPLAWNNGRVEVHAEVSPGLPPVSADPGRLEQVLRNLVHNALRHTPPGGVVAVTASAEGPDIRLDVADTGEGISPDDLPHIWERFYQSKETGRSNGSAGLGLAIVKELTEAMGGRVSVESRPGEGSRFTLWLKSVS